MAPRSEDENHHISVLIFDNRIELLSNNESHSWVCVVLFLIGIEWL